MEGLWPSRVAGFGVCDLWFRVQGFGVWGLGVGLAVSDFGFGVSGFRLSTLNMSAGSKTPHHPTLSRFNPTV